MKIINTNLNYFEEAVDIAFKNYKNECRYVEEMDNCTRDEIYKEMFTAFQKQNGFMCLENEKLSGYLVYADIWESKGILWCNIPLWGYGAIGENKIKILSMLFQSLAEELFARKKLHFEIKLYAHDTEVIRLFSFLQFGTQCEEGIRCINKDNLNGSISSIIELTKEEIKENWDEIWELIKSLIKHLRRSPVFYPGTEFTQEVYKNFMLDNDTRLVVAKIEEHLVGIITANKSGNSFINSQADFYNVGDVYVTEEYRGSKLAVSMLAYLTDILAGEGAKRLWVEHGTANPNARSFWNKYFTSYAYTMNRDIDIF